MLADTGSAAISAQDLLTKWGITDLTDSDCEVLRLMRAMRFGKIIIEVREGFPYTSKIIPFVRHGFMHERGAVLELLSSIVRQAQLNSI
jgi:hypothetical protein